MNIQVFHTESKNLHKAKPRKILHEFPDQIINLGNTEDHTQAQLNVLNTAIWKSRGTWRRQQYYLCPETLRCTPDQPSKHTVGRNAAPWQAALGSQRPCTVGTSPNAKRQGFKNTRILPACLITSAHSGSSSNWLQVWIWQRLLQKSLEIHMPTRRLQQDLCLLWVYP